MKFLYTTNPDKHCHDFKDGTYGRPAHGYELSKLLSEGWVFDVNKLAKESDSKKETKEATKEESVLSRDDLAKSLGISLVDEDGKKLHYKLIDSAIKEAQANEHNES